MFLFAGLSSQAARTSASAHHIKADTSITLALAKKYK